MRAASIRLFFSKYLDNFLRTFFGSGFFMKELVKGKVYYRIFDRGFKESTGIYYEKNETPAEIIEKNKTAVLKETGGKTLCLLNQTHSASVIDADSIENWNVRPEGDASVSAKPGLVSSVVTADCVPVLFYSADGKVVGAAHCGWKGTKSDIIANSVEAMEKKGGRDFKAVIGPSIKAESYEVGSEYRDNFLSEDPGYSKFFFESAAPEKYRFDLRAFVKYKLKEAGVAIEISVEEDTYSTPEKYPSYRRSFQKGRPYRDSILSVIHIKKIGD